MAVVAHEREAGSAAVRTALSTTVNHCGVVLSDLCLPVSRREPKRLRTAETDSMFPISMALEVAYGEIIAALMA
jgi:hypothetical protein